MNSPLFGWLLLGGGALVVLLVVGLALTRLAGTVQARTRWTRTTGTVVDGYWEQHSGDGVADRDLDAHEIILFHTTEGRRVIAEPRHSQKAEPRVGQQVDVRYDPADPTRIEAPYLL